MTFIMSSIIQTCLFIINTSELTVKKGSVRGLWWLGRISAGVKQLPTPVTKPTQLPNRAHCEIVLSYAGSPGQVRSGSLLTTNLRYLVDSLLITTFFTEFGLLSRRFCLINRFCFFPSSVVCRYVLAAWQTLSSSSDSCIDDLIYGIWK